MKYAELPTSLSWYDIAVHSKLIPRGKVFFATASIASSDWPELNPFAGIPLIAAAGKRL